MSKIKNYFIFIIIALIIYPFITFAENSINPEQNQTVVNIIAKKSASKDTGKPKNIQSITPLELDLGTINIDNSSSEGSFMFKNTSAEAVNWSTDGPEGWENLDKQKLSGVLKNNADYLHVEILLLPKEISPNEDKQKNAQNNYVEMKLDTGAGKITCRKELHPGIYKEAVKINSMDGEKIIFVTFIIGYTQKSPLINLYPVRLDMGSILPDKTVSKKIIATNSGKEMLTWSVAVQKHVAEDKPFNLGRYISFANGEARGRGVYIVPGRLKETFELMGKWTESDGYPTGAEGENFIKIHFNGTGIILYLLNGHEEDNLSISLDKRLIDNNDLFKDLKEHKEELLIARDIAYGPHVLTIISRDNRLGFEGVKILGENMSYFPEGSIKIMPNSGAITRQTNYINVSLNTAQMPPGYYLNNIIFNTNGGVAVVEVFAEVVPDSIAKAIDIFRYFNGTDYLYSANPQSEAKRLMQNNYVKEGIAFRLFNADTPGTTSFYRWYNPQRKSHFYHYDLAGGKKDLRGYIFEGSIGNIATSRLTNTRELYRWYNSKTGGYFYSTDIQRGKINKKKYRFDGIAGYVK
ncbi:MAG: hypothetical protein ACLQBQ_04295 [Smithella sp.]